MHVKAQIDIDAPAKVVWDIILDVDNYSQWNPFTPRVGTDFVVGNEFTLDCRMSEKKLIKNVPEIFLSLDSDNLTLSWGTGPSRKGVKGNRTQTVISLSDKHSRYICIEKFRGPLAPLTMLLFKKKLNTGFKLNAEALKNQAETLLNQKMS